MPLQIEYRPDEWEEFLGSEEQVQSLQNRMEKGGKALPHAILITGPSGCGKTTLGRIIASELGAYDPEKDFNINFNELDTAHFGGKEMVRDVRKNMGLAAAGGGHRVWLFDECHQLTRDAQEGLLKALEDFPRHAFFIFCTTEPEKLKITFKRRCLQVELEPLSTAKLISHLGEVCEEEEVEVPKKILKKIALDSMGSAGVALGILDGVIHLKPSQMEKMVEKIAAQKNQVIDLCRSLFKREKWPKIVKILNGLVGEDPERTRRAVMRYCGNIILSGKDEPGAALVMECFRKPFYDNGRDDLILACYEIIVGD